MHHGLRREAERHAAFAGTERVGDFKIIIRPQAVSSLRCATALHDDFISFAVFVKFASKIFLSVFHP